MLDRTFDLETKGSRGRHKREAIFAFCSPRVLYRQAFVKVANKVSFNCFFFKEIEQKLYLIYEARFAVHSCANRLPVGSLHNGQSSSNETCPLRQPAHGTH